MDHTGICVDNHSVPAIHGNVFSHGIVIRRSRLRQHEGDIVMIPL